MNPPHKARPRALRAFNMALPLFGYWKVVVTAISVWFGGAQLPEPMYLDG
jgi:hypothetical protein